MENKSVVANGMAEVSVKELIALEKSVNEKDQLIGALREQVKQQKEKIEEVKATADEKCPIVKIVVAKTNSTLPYTCTSTSPLYWGDYQIPSVSNESIKSIEYKNLDDVIGKIREEESKKLQVSIPELENKVNLLNLEKERAKNDFDFQLKSVEEKLFNSEKNKEKEISDAKEGIRKRLNGIIDELNKEIESLQEEIKKVKKDKVNEAFEEARKKEIIDLKERIYELEQAQLGVDDLKGIKKILYNWMKVDFKAKVKAAKELAEKRDRVNKISNTYPRTKQWWVPSWMEYWFGLN